jgi:uncharacterized membrane protein
MTEEGQPRRSVSRKFYKQLESELETWKQQGTVTSKQAETILSNYVVVSPLYGRIIVILVTLGAILAGVGIILFVSANWQVIPRPWKLALFLAMVITILLPGYWLKYEKNFPRAGGALLLVGALVFGAAVFLVGQQYHMPVDDPALLIWWLIGIIPLAYFTRSRAILTIAILIALLGLGYKTSDWLNVSSQTYAFLPFYLMLGLVLYGLGSIHQRFDRLRFYTSRYQSFGLTLIFIVLYIFSFKFIYGDSIPLDLKSLDLPAAFVRAFHISAALAIICAVGSFAIDVTRKRLSYIFSSDLAIIVFFVAMGYVALFLPFQNPASYAVLFNLVLFAGIVGLVFLGYFRGRSYFINIALIFFGIAVVSRYFEFTWDLLPRSVFFILGGVLLLGGGILLERLRRRTLRQMRAIEVVDESET